MRYHHCWVSIILLGIIAGLSSPGWTARKYYPPGFTPPATETQAPAEPATPPPPPPSGGRQVIIKTIPVSIPQDPLMILLNEHRYFEALRLVDSRLKRSPNNVNLQLTRGNILRNSDRFEQALTQFRNLESRNHTKSIRALSFNGMGWTHYRQAVQSEQAGNTDGLKRYVQAAGHAFRQSLQLSPALAEAWAGLGRTYLLEHRLPEAETAIKKALRFSPNGLPSLLAHAELLLAKDKPQEALSVLYGLKRNTTHEPDVFLFLAQASLATNRVDDAIINLKQLLEISPEHTAALKLLSQSYENKMMPEDAELTLQKAIAINPGDEKSVNALLKIYDQRKEPERGLLLLKTLLKTRPAQPRYVKELLIRLEHEQQWEEAYVNGVNLVPALLANPQVSSEEKQELQHLFALAVYWQSRDRLDSRTVLNDPAVQDLQSILEQASIPNKQAAVDKTVLLETQRDLLLLDPLNPSAKSTLASGPSMDNLPLALQVAYLAGEQALYEQLFASASISPHRITAARHLADVGDYTGALRLVDQTLQAGSASGAKSQKADIQKLREQITERQKQVQEHLLSISMLPRKVPDTYFEKAASEALRLGSGYWETHAVLASALEKRRAYRLAVIQQKLAAHFAPTEKDRKYWQRKSDRTAKNIKS